MTKRELSEAVARGWNHAETEQLKLNPDLANAIVEEVWKIDNKPNLGCATTMELIEELLARAQVAHVTGEEWPKYKTVSDA